MSLACVAARREPFVLLECVLNTMAEARALSTRCLYALKWAIFSTWWQDRDLDPVTSDVSVVLSFLQEMLDKQRSSSTIKVSQPTVLRLLTQALVKWVGDLQALSVNPDFLEFGPNDSKDVLKPRLGYVPKVLSTPFRAQVIMLSAFSPPTASQESLLCPVRALRIYIEHYASYRKSEQLIVGFGNHAKGGPVTKQRLSKWLVDAITLEYSSSWLQCPMGLRAHSTKGIASSWAWSSGVSISDIYKAAGWSSPSTFARFYNLDVPVLQARVLSA